MSRGSVRRAIDRNEYTLLFVWDYLEEWDKKVILGWVITASKYGQRAHMGMLPFLGLGELWQVFKQVEVFRNAPVQELKLVEQYRAMIRMHVAADITKKYRTAKQEKLERKRYERALRLQNCQRTGRVD